MRFVKGNLLDADADALVNTVNTVGVMGKGIALQFKEKFPVNFQHYTAACKNKELQIGKLLVVKEKTVLDGEKIIINFPTKTEWFQKSRYEYIEAGLAQLVIAIREHNIASIAIPPLGCGNGGLKWDKVKVIMEQHLSPLTNVDIQIFEPSETVKQLLKEQDVKKKVKLTPARAMLLYSMFYYESLGENSSLFIANKLAYFLQRLGEKSFAKLQFDASHYGPYNVGVEHMLHNVNGVYLKGLEQMNAKAFEPLELQYDKVKELSEYVRKELSSEQVAILKNLLELVDGFQSALSLEVLATVDFIKRKYNVSSFQEIKNEILNWSERKKSLFKDRYIQIAIDHLEKYSNRLNFNVS